MLKEAARHPADAPGSYAGRGRRFDSLVKHLAGGDLPLRAQDLKTRDLSNLNPRDPGPLRAAR
jgi:hypothetical protein